MAGSWTNTVTISCIIGLTFMIGAYSNQTPIYMCESQIYCQGPILETVNRLAIFNDSKHYVDMPLKKSPQDTLAAFKQQFPDTKNISKDDMRKFLQDYFYEPGVELSNCNPPDWEKDPPNFQLIKDANYRQWAYELHGIWLRLCRKINDTIKTDFEKNSLIYVPNNFIAPGGRFREYYYWDTYWIIRGLLVSQMYDTAKDIIRNFGWLVSQHGFIPNGGRMYYMQRSQPPFFIPMVYEYYAETLDLKFLRDMLPLMSKELEWWQANRTVTVKVDGKNYTVYQYRTISNTPRPEMWKEDVDLAERVKNEDKAYLYQNIATGAEAGMDFGSRYFGDLKDMATIRITDILPVDLNAVLCWCSKILAAMYRETGKYDTAKDYINMHADFQEMMTAVFYNKTEGTWFDRDLIANQHLNHFYPSNAVPLFTGCYDSVNQPPDRLYNYLKRVNALSFPSGIPSSLIETGQQWDFPNGWPPQVHMIIEGFRKSGHQAMQEHAFELANSWLKVNYLVYKKTNHMYEKYNVSDTTYQPGGGGEYEVQTGFGWTNGVVLDLLRTYGARLIAPNDDKPVTAASTQIKPVPTEPSSAYHALPSVGTLFCCIIAYLTSLHARWLV